MVKDKAFDVKLKVNMVDILIQTGRKQNSYIKAGQEIK